MQRGWTRRREMENDDDDDDLRFVASVNRLINFLFLCNIFFLSLHATSKGVKQVQQPPIFLALTIVPLP